MAQHRINGMKLTAAFMQRQEVEPEPRTKMLHMGS
jgi:hypothetical protein